MQIVRTRITPAGAPSGELLCAIDAQEAETALQKSQ